MRETLKAFLLEQAERLKRHPQDLCTQTGRPYEYLSHAARKEDLARKIAERDEITEGLVCVLSVVEPCRTYSLVWNGRSPYVQRARRRCLHFSYYFLDQDQGLIHVRLQSWFSFQIQIYVNGHEWLARQRDRQGINYMKLDHAFVRRSEVERSQELADVSSGSTGFTCSAGMPCESILCSGRGKVSTRCSTTGLRPSPSTRPTSCFASAPTSRS